MAVYVWYQVFMDGPISQVRQSQNFLDFKEKEVKLTSDNFQVSVSLPFTREHRSAMNIMKYLNFRGVLINKDEDGEEAGFHNLDLQPCAEQQSLKTSFEICLNVEKDIKFQTANDEIKLYFFKCDDNILWKYYPSEVCETDSQLIQKFVDNYFLMVKTKTIFFDSKATAERDNDKPEDFFKTQVISSNMSMDSGSTAVMNFILNSKILKGSTSFLHESLFYFEREFMSSKIQLTDRVPSRSDYLEISFQVQGDQQVVEIIPNNIVAILSNLGGFSGIIYSIVQMILAPLQRFVYYKKVIKKTYLYDEQIFASQGNENAGNKVRNAENEYNESDQGDEGSDRGDGDEGGDQ
ncbi:UNKNOWN [Stylonychia lemnae]|uniref:Uncharacterized protein n=1 Tax=Stylonychia lemnae TaxID=5949 RepID=A0A078A7L2_STYLE|nr:UNKNOWN [Stylonychia lemnae]|eukprot:CDW77547.1 UNKNOWN [Stylonychia lemnae]